jgi:hypothetical protein
MRTPSNLGFTASQSSADSGTHPESQNLWPLVLEGLGLARGDGRYARMLKSLARVQVLILDDWG